MKHARENLPTRLQAGGIADGREESVRAGDVYYWPPGHTVWVDEDYEAVEFSPSGPMGRVIDHLKSKLQT